MVEYDPHAELAAMQQSHIETYEHEVDRKVHAALQYLTTPRVGQTCAMR